MTKTTVDYFFQGRARPRVVGADHGPLIGWFTQAHAAPVADNLRRRQGREVQAGFMFICQVGRQVGRSMGAKQWTAPPPRSRRMSAGVVLILVGLSAARRSSRTSYQAPAASAAANRPAKT